MDVAPWITNMFFAALGALAMLLLRHWLDVERDKKKLSMERAVAQQDREANARALAEADRLTAEEVVLLTSALKGGETLHTYQAMQRPRVLQVAGIVYDETEERRLLYLTALASLVNRGLVVPTSEKGAMENFRLSSSGLIRAASLSSAQQEEKLTMPEREILTGALDTREINVYRMQSTPNVVTVDGKDHAGPDREIFLAALASLEVRGCIEEEVLHRAPQVARYRVTAKGVLLASKVKVDAGAGA